MNTFLLKIGFKVACQKAALLFVLLAGTFSFVTAQNSWNGATSTDWATDGNWSLGHIPLATEDVVIPSAPSNQPVLSTAGAVASTVEVRNSATLTIQSSGSLAVNGSKIIGGGTTAFYNNGTVSNSGSLLIGDVSSVGSYGLYNLATFTNNTGGQISIDRATSFGLYNSGGNFTNAAAITIGALGSVGNYGVYNLATFNNNAGGQISIDRSMGAAVYNAGTFTNASVVTMGAAASIGSMGIYNGAFIENKNGGHISIDNSTSTGLLNGAGTFTNTAIIEIGATANVGQIGLRNNATFNNNPGGEIRIENSTDNALETIGGTFTNASNIIIGATASAGSYGIQNKAIFNNNSGQISIDRTTYIGLYNNTGTFTNSAAITIGATSGVGTFGLYNQSAFTNSGCAVLAVFARISNYGSFTNAGLLNLNTTQGHSNSSLTNNGIIVYQQGNPVPNVTNNKLIAGPVSTLCGPINPALEIGGGNDLVIGNTWYQDAAFTTIAGIYNINAFNPTDLPVGGPYPVYFTVNDPVNGCTRTVSIPVTVNGTASTWYKDVDGDGYSDGSTITACERPDNYKLPGELGGTDGDCKDDDGAIHPAATEVCDGVDNNCDEVIDEGSTNTDGDSMADCVDPDDDNDGTSDEFDCAALDGTKWRSGNFYTDGDGDGYGTGTAVSLCYGTNTPQGNSLTGGDCNDAIAAINPGATEICDGIDNNCNGTIDEGCNITACGVVTGLSTTNITNTSARLNWVSPIDPTQWQLQYKTVAPGAKWKDVIPSPATNARTVVITGLTVNQSYQWHIKARCGKTWTSYYESVPFKTLAAGSILAKSNNYTMPAETGEKSTEIKLYPNPSNGKVTIELHMAENDFGTAKLELVDMKGRTVYMADAAILNGAIQKTFIMSHSLAAGMYTVKITANNKLYFSKVVYNK